MALELLSKACWTEKGRRVRTVPWLILDGQKPTFRDLADEAFAMARRQAFSDDTLQDRLEYWRRSRRLRRAARWAGAREWTHSQFIWRVGVRRYALVIFAVPAALLALYALSNQSTLILGFLWVLSILAVISLIVGIVMASSTWARIDPDVRWAENYRLERMEIDARLRSAEGYQGWRARRDADGGWTLEPL
jgi:hypothetical protein